MPYIIGKYTQLSLYHIFVTSLCVVSHFFEGCWDKINFGCDFLNYYPLIR